MKRDVLLLARGIVGLAAVMLLLLGAGLAVDLWNQGYQAGGLLTFDIAEARHFGNVLNRNLNQLVAVVFTTVAIAVPLTANSYSLKFLELFIKDPVNAAALTLVVFANLANTWWNYALKDDFVPVFQLHLSLAFVIVTFSLLFPYLYYIFRFPHPNTLLERLEGEITAELRAAGRRGAHVTVLRRQVAAEIEHIANIAIRSVDRADRNTAIESVASLERVARAYEALKEGMPPAWYEADANSFLGFSSKAVEEIASSHTWVEMKIFSQLRQIMSAAIPQLHDLVSTIAKTLRRLGLEEAARRDLAVRETVVEYFNTFVRMAINRRDLRSVFSLFDQYRTLAEAFNDEYPELVLEIAYYFKYYGQIARDYQLTFIVEVVAHDLGALVQHAWRTESSNRHELLQQFLSYDLQARPPLPGVKKAQALLGSYFLLSGQAEAAALTRSSFAGLDPDYVHALKEDLLHVVREKYWEVNERRMNIDYVPDPQRVKLREFLDSVNSAETA